MSTGTPADAGTVATSPDWPEWMHTSRPRVRPAVRVGPALLDGTRTSHVLGDADTGGFLRVGPREAFLVARLDGTRTPVDLADEYAEEFGRMLGPDHFTQLFALLGSRCLLEPAPAEQLRELTERATRQRRESGRTPMLRRWPVRGAAAAVERIAPATSWLLHPVLVVPMSLLGALAMVVAAEDAARLSDDVGAASWSAVLAGAVIAWLLILAHEVAHGVACVRYGGRPTEVGLMWRFPLVAPYCKVDDVVTFPHAWQRMMTSYAGVHVNLAAQAPLVGLWWTSADAGGAAGWWHGVLGVAIVANTMSVVVNLLPVLQLDGYHVLEHGLSCLHLQRQTVRFLAASVRRPRLDAYGPRARWTYGGYALLAGGLLVTALLLLVSAWYDALSGWWGPIPAVAFLLAEAVLLVAFVQWARGRAQDRRSGAQEVVG